MRSYGQYCPIARASEIIAERWTPLVLRNVLVGCSTFGEIAAGVPQMSRSLLAKRLGELERAGVLTSAPKTHGRGKSYALTDAGRDLWGVMDALGAWGERWLEIGEEHTDPAVALWGWTRSSLRREVLPEGRVLVRFEFPQERPANRLYWLLVDGGDGEMCAADPGFAEDLRVVAESAAFVRWHVGQVAWRDAVRAGSIAVTGPAELRRALPTWNVQGGS